jgi:ABC-2 type transport system ATP-binding protein
MEPAIEIVGLRKEYKGFTLKDISFALPEGYVMGLIGPNGAGKTTIIKLIMNLIRKNAGEIRIFGLDHIRHEAEIKSRIGFVYDIPRFYDDVRLKEIQSAIAPFYSKWDEGRFLKLCREFDLPLKQKFKKLSHGMKMKFSLALALSHDADLILMDEPTAGLDPAFRLELLDRIATVMQDERKSILFSTHITSDLERIADYITFIHEGSVVFSAGRDDIFENWGVVKAAPDILEKTKLPGLRGFRRSDFGIEALTSEAGKAREARIPGAIIERATLEDIMYLTAKGINHA